VPELHSCLGMRYPTNYQDKWLRFLRIRHRSDTMQLESEMLRGGILISRSPDCAFLRVTQQYDSIKSFEKRIQRICAAGRCLRCQYVEPKPFQSASIEISLYSSDSCVRDCVQCKVTIPFVTASPGFAAARGAVTVHAKEFVSLSEGFPSSARQ